MTKLKNKKEIEEKILAEKHKGTPDKEIGKTYGVNLKYIEKIITKTKGVNISKLNIKNKIKSLYPKDFKEETTTFWSFKKRGNWATHSGEYRGNWSPYIPRNVILKYSKPSEVVLDYFCGAGTTAIECKLLGRRCIALDINEKAIELAKEKINFDYFLELPFEKQIYEPELLVGDARNLSFLKDNSIDLICSHPPYANIIQYTYNKEGDLSLLSIEEFLNEMQKVAKESFRVLKPSRQCAILIGDTRRKKYIIPLGFKLMDIYLNAGFKIREIIIKQQHNCKTTGFWYKNSIKYNFLLLAHEYLFIFEKPKIDTKTTKESILSSNPFISPIEQKQDLPKIDKLETTTIWKFKKEFFESQIDKNVIERYSRNKTYNIFALNITKNSINTEEISHTAAKPYQLLFIKSHFDNIILTHKDIEKYSLEIKKLVAKNLNNIENRGFIVIQTEDVRINGYIEPLAKKVMDILSIHTQLNIKEIIITIIENESEAQSKYSNYLTKVHKYLLVYEVKK